MSKSLFSLPGVCLLASLGPLSPTAANAQARCAMPSTMPPEQSQVVTTENLLSLRDFGGTSVGITSTPFEMAPDDTILALQIRQADAKTDSYCSAIVLLPTNASAKATVIDDGGEIVPAVSSRYGMSELPLGIPKPAIMRWSPNGEKLAYIKNLTSGAELWLYDRQHQISHRLFRSLVDINAIAWTGDGSALVYASKPGIIDARAATDTEGQSGYHYDGRFWPLSSDRPFLSPDVPTIEAAIDPDTGQSRPFLPSYRQALYPSTTRPKAALAFTGSADGKNLAWSAPMTAGYPAKTTLQLRMKGRELECASESCTNVAALWWSEDGGTLFLERRSGIADNRTQFYAWRPGGRMPPRLILDTANSLFGCKMAKQKLICAQETSTAPRKIVSLSLRKGEIGNLFDPNPEFAKLVMGKVKRLEWTNAFGIPTFGDLVLPANADGKRKLPLVVIQYDSRGFLRGGTGDEYPIQVLASHGFAVLSFNRPPWYGSLKPAKDEIESIKASITDWADRRSNLSSLETIIKQLAADGTIDPARVAITGQSDGSSTATFALSNSRIFSAAILSTCCEAETMLALSGEGFADFYKSIGYPASDAPDFWREGSLLGAKQARPVPLLIEASSSEYRLSLVTYRDLKARGWPIDMYVFPDEGHVKFHPAHRLAIYRRNIEWLTDKLKP